MTSCPTGTLTSPATAVRLNSFNWAAFGGSVNHIADINDDGELEILTLQTVGQMGAELENRAALGVDEDDRDLYCLTAVTLTGDVLWQRGVPCNRPGLPFASHGGSRMLLIEDLDADGKTEVAVIRHQEIAVLDGASGAVKASVKLPADNFVSLFSAQFGPPENGRQIICKVNNRAYEPWEYSNPTIVYNADLSVYHEPFAVRGAGHNMVALDVNGDGRDELLIGYSLLDHELNTIWRLDFGPDFNYAHDHADQIAVSDLKGDGDLVVRFAGSEDFYTTDLDGNILSTSQAGHSQTSIAGNWGPNGEPRMIMCEKNNGLWGMLPDGEILWYRPELNGYARANVRWSKTSTPGEWPIFKPALKPFPETPYKSEAAWSEGLWPCLLDGDGNCHRVFPWHAEYAQEDGRTIRSKRSYDSDVGYQVRAVDLDNDGLDEVLIFDRSRVWIFGSPETH